MKNIFTYPNNSGTHYIDPNYIGDANSGFYKRVDELRDGTYQSWYGYGPVDTTDEILEGIGKYNTSYKESWDQNTIYRFWINNMTEARFELIESDITTSIDVHDTQSTLYFSEPHGFYGGHKFLVTGLDGIWSQFNGQEFWVDKVDAHNIKLCLSEDLSDPIYFYNLLEGDFASYDFDNYGDSDTSSITFTIPDVNDTLSNGMPVLCYGFDGSFGTLLNGNTAYVSIDSGNQVSLYADAGLTNEYNVYHLGYDGTCSADVEYGGPARLYINDTSIKDGMPVELSGWDGSMGAYNGSVIYLHEESTGVYNFSTDGNPANIITVDSYDETGNVLSLGLGLGGIVRVTMAANVADAPDGATINETAWADASLETETDTMGEYTLGISNDMNYMLTASNTTIYLSKQVASEWAVQDTLTGYFAKNARMTRDGTKIVAQNQTTGNVDVITISGDAFGSVSTAIAGTDIETWNPSASESQLEISNSGTRVFVSDYLYSTGAAPGRMIIADYSGSWSSTYITNPSSDDYWSQAFAIAKDGNSFMAGAWWDGGSTADRDIYFYHYSGSWTQTGSVTRTLNSANDYMYSHYLTMSDDGLTYTISSDGFANDRTDWYKRSNINTLTSTYSGNITDAKYGTMSGDGELLYVRDDSYADVWTLYRWNGATYANEWQSWYTADVQERPMTTYQSWQPIVVSGYDISGSLRIYTLKFSKTTKILKVLSNNFADTLYSKKILTNTYELYSDAALTTRLDWTSISNSGLTIGSYTAEDGYVTYQFGAPLENSTQGYTTEHYTVAGPWELKSISPVAPTTGDIIETKTPEVPNQFIVTYMTSASTGTVTIADDEPKRYRLSDAHVILPGVETFTYRDVNGDYIGGAELRANTYQMPGEWLTFNDTDYTWDELTVSLTPRNSLGSVDFDPEFPGMYPNDLSRRIIIRRLADQYVAPTQTLAEQQDNWDMDTEWDTNGYNGAKEWPDRTEGVTPSSVKLTYNQPNTITVAQNGTKYVRNLGFQKWQLEVEYPPLTEEEFRHLHVAAQNARGQFTPFYFINRDQAGNPLVLDYRASGISTNTPRVKEKIDAGDNEILLEGFGSFESNVVTKGELFIPSSSLGSNGGIMTAMTDVNANVYGEARIKIPYGAQGESWPGSQFYFAPYHFIVTLSENAFEYEIDTFGMYYVRVTFDFDEFK